MTDLEPEVVFKLFFMTISEYIPPEVLKPISERLAKDIWQLINSRKTTMEQKKWDSQISNQDIQDLHWMARRYADGRQSYATGLFNQITKRLLAAEIELNPTGDGTIWAKDARGRAYDGLSDEEAAV